MKKIVKKFNLYVTFLDYAYIIGWSKIRKYSSDNAKIYILYITESFFRHNVYYRVNLNNYPGKIREMNSSIVC